MGRRFIWLGISLLDDLLLNESEQVLRQAIALDPKDSPPHLWLAQAHERQGNLKASVSCYRAGLALKPHYGEADARLGLASVLKNLGHLDEAITEWRTIASMEPMYPS